jgi:hypothetical protein
VRDRCPLVPVDGWSDLHRFLAVDKVESGGGLPGDPLVCDGLDCRIERVEDRRQTARRYVAVVDGERVPFVLDVTTVDRRRGAFEQPPYRLNGWPIAACDRVDPDRIAGRQLEAVIARVHETGEADAWDQVPQLAPADHCDDDVGSRREGAEDPPVRGRDPGLVRRGGDGR